MFEGLLLLALANDAVISVNRNPAQVEVQMEYHIPERLENAEVVVFPGKGCWSKITGKRLGEKCQDLGDWSGANDPMPDSLI